MVVFHCASLYILPVCLFLDSIKFSIFFAPRNFQPSTRTDIFLPLLDSQQVLCYFDLFLPKFLAISICFFDFQALCKHSKALLERDLKGSWCFFFPPLGSIQ
jgi:hypothetical protein